MIDDPFVAMVWLRLRLLFVAFLMEMSLYLSHSLTHTTPIQNTLHIGIRILYMNGKFKDVKSTTNPIRIKPFSSGHSCVGLVQEPTTFMTKGRIEVATKERENRD